MASTRHSSPSHTPRHNADSNAVFFAVTSRDPAALSQGEANASHLSRTMPELDGLESDQLKSDQIDSAVTPVHKSQAVDISQLSPSSCLTSPLSASAFSLSPPAGFLAPTRTSPYTPLSSVDGCDADSPSISNVCDPQSAADSKRDMLHPIRYGHHETIGAVSFCPGPFLSFSLAFYAQIGLAC